MTACDLTSEAVDLVTHALTTLRRGAPVVEARLLGVPRDGTLTGFFDNDAALVDAIAPYDGRCNIYLVMNEVPRELLARAHNRLKRPATTRGHGGDSELSAKDAEIRRRTWLLVDCDAGQYAGIPSTDAEAAASGDLRTAVVQWLAELGWPRPVLADSGNGSHALYPILLPNTTTGIAGKPDPSADLVRRVLVALAARFPPEEFGGARIDTTVYNASRLTRLYGTLNVRGDGTPDRPHRRSRITAW